MENSMMALRKKRFESREYMPDGDGSGEAEPKDEMAQYWAKIQAIDAKLDQVLEILGGESEEVQPEAEVA